MSGNGPERELIARHEEHVRAWCELDLDALERLYDPDCLIFDTYPPPVHRGWDEFRGRIGPILEEHDEFRIRTHDRVARAEGDLGWVASRYQIEGRRGGRDYRTSGRWTEIYSRRVAGWRLVHLHTSVDPGDG